MKGSEDGEKGERKEKKKGREKNGGTRRDCLDMHAALAVGLKIRQLSGGILASRREYTRPSVERESDASSCVFPYPRD